MPTGTGAAHARRIGRADSRASKIHQISEP